MLIEAPDFQTGNFIQFLSLQGDWNLTNRPGPAGGKYVIEDPERAHSACMTFMARLHASQAEIAMVPELAIPRATVPSIIRAIENMERPVLFLGGVEGQTRDEYESLLTAFDGETQALATSATDNYVNSLLIVLKTPNTCRVFQRAKRVPSKAETDGPPMARGAGPFIRISLGTKPLIAVPLVCSEFVWPEEMWNCLDAEVPEDIDLIPVLQQNLDAEAKHTSPILHTAYTRSRTKHTRFLFVNQAIGSYCDGTCYVIVPPKSPGPPDFDHGRNELWKLPSGATYKGFRIPDLTGCIWAARLAMPGAPQSALNSLICEGEVTEVLSPEGFPLRGLPIGLMRSAAVLLYRKIVSSPLVAAREALRVSSPGYVLRQLDTNSAKDVFFRMQNGTPLNWVDVLTVVEELVEGASLLASGADETALVPCEEGNYRVTGHPMLILYAPDVDQALAQRFPISASLEGTPKPLGVLLIGVRSGSIAVGAHRIGDVLQADRVSSSSLDLLDSPKRTEDSSVTIRLGDVEFRCLHDLKGNWKLASTTSARERLKSLFPKVYA